MLTWYKDLYVGKMAKRHQGRIITNVEDRRFQSRVYLITLPVNTKNTLEIVPSSNLLQSIVYNRTPMIIGIAEGYDEAMAMVTAIIQETYAETKTTDVASYLKSKE